MSLQRIRRFVLAAILAPALTAWAGTYTWGGNTYSYTAQVNISGATLFQGFFGAPASTNDFIDANGNGVAGFSLTPPYVDQLSTGFPGNTSGSNNYWLVQYRGVGSGSGLAELDSFYNTAPTTLSIPDYSSIARSMVWTGGASGTAGAAYTSANSALGGTPVAPNSIDIAIMDVPTRWLVQAGSQADAAWNKAPTSSGYGKNPIGITTGGATNKVKSLTNLNINAVPDSKTIVDTSVAWVPTAIIANRGTGLQNVTQTDLQHLYVTGRMPNGENLVAATRDPGSGTKNATIKTGKAYVAGDSRGDIAGNMISRGAGPTGADGTIDAKDIDYVQLVVHGGLVPAGVTPSAGFMADGSLHWSNLNEAVFCDLSADITGDLVVGKADVDELVNGILHTNYGDANLDGKVSFSDYLTLEQNFGKTGKGWAEGDFTGDGNVKFADYLCSWSRTSARAPRSPSRPR